MMSGRWRLLALTLLMAAGMAATVLRLGVKVQLEFGALSPRALSQLRHRSSVADTAVPDVVPDPSEFVQRNGTQQAFAFSEPPRTVKPRPECVATRRCAALQPSAPDADSATATAMAPRVNIAMISHGWEATAGSYHTSESIKGPKLSLEVAIQGVLRVTQCPIHLVLVTGRPEEAHLRGFLQPLARWRCDFSFEFVRLNAALLDEWMSGIGHTASHRTGRAGNVKFFYSTLFPRLDRVLMLDSDVIVATDICILWAHFDRFGPEQLYAFAPQWKLLNPAKDNQFNAGVGLLRLDRMRRVGWHKLARDAIAYWDGKGMQPKCCAHGDQSAFHMVRFYRPSAMPEPLPRWWNINKCHRYHGLQQDLVPVPRNANGTRNASVGAATIINASSSATRGGANTSARGVARVPTVLGTHPPPPGVFVGLVHLGCCKLCTRAKIGSRWAQLYDWNLGARLTKYDHPSCLGAAEEVALTGAGDRNLVHSDLAPSPPAAGTRRERHAASPAKNASAAAKGTS